MELFHVLLRGKGAGLPTAPLILVISRQLWSKPVFRLLFFCDMLGSRKHKRSKWCSWQSVLSFCPRVGRVKVPAQDAKKNPRECPANQEGFVGQPKHVVLAGTGVLIPLLFVLPMCLPTPRVRVALLSVENKHCQPVKISREDTTR